MIAGLEIHGLTKAYGAEPVLRGLDLTVEPGSLTAVLGRSGCGKTTLLRLVAGFDMPDAGTVDVGGRRMAATRHCLPPEQRRIGYVTQEGSLFPHLTVAGNIVFGLPWQARRARNGVAGLLELVGLDERYSRRFPHELSGGEQQRVALARALAPAPDLVLLDEPFSALDTELRASTRAAVVAALAAAGTTTVLVTHDQSEALSVASRIAVLRDGVIVQQGTPAQVYQLPVDQGVAAFLGELVAVPAVIRGDRAETAIGRLQVSTPGSTDSDTVYLRPEQISITDCADGIRGTVLDVRFHGHTGTVRVRVGGDVVVSMRCPGHQLPAVGDVVALGVTGMAIRM